METVKKSLRAKGYSDKVSQLIMVPHAPSTAAIYKGKWRVYAAWCANIDVDPFEASTPQIAEFFYYLYDTKGLTFKTIEGYRSAIARPIRIATGRDIAQESTLSDLLKSIHRHRPTITCSYPKWDLHLVLWSLARAPFEPIQQISLRNLTLKTAFLVLLASGSRCSEVHALSFRSFSFAQDWREVSIEPIPSFIAKTQFRASGDSVLKKVKIPSLASSLGPGLDQDKKLCPVRCLKVYLSRTQDLRRNKQLLFISYQPNRQKDISKITLSSWVKRLLSDVYGNPSKDAAQLVGRTTHEIRAMAATLAFTSQAGLDEVLKACTWKSHSTFTSFYLRDMAHTREELFTLGPLVAAQKVVLPH